MFPERARGAAGAGLALEPRWRGSRFGGRRMNVGSAAACTWRGSGGVEGAARGAIGCWSDARMARSLHSRSISWSKV